MGVLVIKSKIGSNTPVSIKGSSLGLQAFSAKKKEFKFDSVDKIWVDGEGDIAMHMSDGELASIHFMEEKEQGASILVKTPSGAGLSSGSVVLPEGSMVSGNISEVSCSKNTLVLGEVQNCVGCEPVVIDESVARERIKGFEAKSKVSLFGVTIDIYGEFESVDLNTGDQEDTVTCNLKKVSFTSLKADGNLIVSGDIAQYIQS